jgi:hypothetical protein
MLHENTFLFPDKKKTLKSIKNEPYSFIFFKKKRIICAYIYIYIEREGELNQFYYMDC